MLATHLHHPHARRGAGRRLYETHGSLGLERKLDLAGAESTLRGTHLQGYDPSGMGRRYARHLHPPETAVVRAVLVDAELITTDKDTRTDLHAEAASHVITFQLTSHYDDEDTTGSRTECGRHSIHRSRR